MQPILLSNKPHFRICFVSYHARAVTKTPKHHHITLVLKSLHWLSVSQRFDYKIVSLAYNSLLFKPRNPLHSTIRPTHHPAAWVYTLISRLPCSLIFSEHPLRSLYCTSSLERTPKRPPSVYNTYSSFI